MWLAVLLLTACADPTAYSERAVHSDDDALLTVTPDVARRHVHLHAFIARYDDDPLRREAALRALGMTNDPAAAPAFEVGLRTHPEVTIAAIAANASSAACAVLAEHVAKHPQKATEQGRKVLAGPCGGESQP